MGHLLWFGMLAAVDLDDQAFFQTNEICREDADWVLAPKTEAVDLTTAERAPETPFGVAHGRAQLLSAFD